LGTAEGERVRHRGHRPCAEREQKHVVRELFAAVARYDVSIGIDCGDHPLPQIGAGGIRHRRQREAPYLTDAKRLNDRERAIRKLALRGDELERDAVLGERAQRERRFECGDAATGDDDPDSLPGGRQTHCLLRR
jgi:hypothetical protein